MKRFILLASLLGALALHAAELRGRVVKVSDGDTITVLDADRKQHKVRLDKIDAPEKKQAFGDKSREHLAGFIAGKEVTVEWKKKDRYGRILGTVKHNGLDINLQMVKDGYAWHYKHFDNTPEYAAAENIAREQRIGLWTDSSPTPPFDFRKRRKA